MYFLYNCFVRKTNETHFEKKLVDFLIKGMQETALRSDRLSRKSVELTCMENA